jgi:hypothetical protein
MKKTLMTCLLILATILPTFATNWVQVGEKQYLDTDTIEPFIDDYGRRVPNQYSFWVKLLNTNSNSIKLIEKRYNKKVWYTMYKEVIDLKRKTSATKFYTFYDLKGGPISGEEINGVLMEWSSIIPNTVGELEYLIIRDYASREIR